MNSPYNNRVYFLTITYMKYIKILLLAWVIFVSTAYVNAYAHRWNSDNGQDGNTNEELVSDNSNIGIKNINNVNVKDDEDMNNEDVNDNQDINNDEDMNNEDVQTEWLQWEATFAVPLFGMDTRLQLEKKDQFNVEVDDTNVTVNVFDSTLPLTVATASLDGSQVGSGVTTQAMGSALFLIDTETNMLHYVITFSGLKDNEISAHIHGPAGLGENAGILFPLSLGNVKVGTWNYDESTESAILAGKTYVNIHSKAYPNGEIRGQIMPIILTENQ